MKPRHSFVSNVLLILAFLCAISISSVAQGSPPPGRLIVERVPNFGWNLAVHLQIDSRDAGVIVQGHRYESTLLTVRPGYTYVFTAMWDSYLVYLRGSEVLSPGELWQLRP